MWFTYALVIIGSIFLWNSVEEFKKSNRIKGVLVAFISIFNFWGAAYRFWTGSHEVTYPFMDMKPSILPFQELNWVHFVAAIMVVIFIAGMISAFLKARDPS